MNLFTQTFSKCKAENRAAFVAYITAGDPTFEQSLEVVDRLVNANVDILELGVPFSDPVADGPTNQQASDRALASGMTARKVLELASEIRKKHPQLPLVLFTYMNPVVYSGDFNEFCQKAVESGINGILPLDTPPEESREFRKIMDNAGLQVVRLITPTSSEDRTKLLTEDANAFIYYVCQEGVTGERQNFASGVKERISMIKKHTSLPVVVGFGISTPKHVKDAVATGVDGVVVGSAIVKKVANLADNSGSLDDIEAFVKTLTSALN